MMQMFPLPISAGKGGTIAIVLSFHRHEKGPLKNKERLKNGPKLFANENKLKRRRQFVNYSYS